MFWVARLQRGGDRVRGGPHVALRVKTEVSTIPRFPFAQDPVIADRDAITDDGA